MIRVTALSLLPSLCATVESDRRGSIAPIPNLAFIAVERAAVLLWLFLLSFYFPRRRLFTWLRLPLAD